MVVDNIQDSAFVTVHSSVNVQTTLWFRIGNAFTLGQRDVHEKLFLMKLDRKCDSSN